MAVAYVQTAGLCIGGGCSWSSLQQLPPAIPLPVPRREAWGVLTPGSPRQCPRSLSGQRSAQPRAHQLLLEIGLSPSRSCGAHHPHTNADITGQRRCSSNTK